DREHEEAGPPGSDLDEGIAVQPERVAGNPEERAEQERGGRRGRVRAQDHDEERCEHAAGEEQHELADPRPDAGEEERGARERAGRGEVAPGAAQRDRALERDDGAEEAEHHQRPVELDQVRPPCGRLQPRRKRPAQTPRKSEAIPSASSGARRRTAIVTTVLYYPYKFFS